MSYPKFDLGIIEKWAYSTALDEDLSLYAHNDPHGFEMAIRGACSLHDLFRMAADPSCRKRLYFARLLVPELCWIHRARVCLPFQSPRLCDFLDKDSYLKKTAEHAEAIYERAEIIEKMRISQDPALQAFAQAVMDHLLGQLEPKQKEYIDLLRSVDSKAAPLFTDA